MAFRYYSPVINTKQNNCVARALSVALNIKYQDITEIIKNVDWRDMLLKNGFKEQHYIAKKDHVRQTVANVASTCHHDDIVVCQCANHVVVIQFNDYYDVFDSGQLIVYNTFTRSQK